MNLTAKLATIRIFSFSKKELKMVLDLYFNKPKSSVSIKKDGVQYGMLFIPKDYLMSMLNRIIRIECAFPIPDKVHDMNLMPKEVTLIYSWEDDLELTRK